MKHKEGQVKKTPLTKELLHELYVVKGLSMHRIAEDTGWRCPTIRNHIIKEGMQPRSVKEGKRMWSQRELERVRKHIRLNVPELLKDLDVEYTKKGCIKVRSLPPEVRGKFKNEALRLREIGGLRPTIVARLLGIPRMTLHGWYHPEVTRDACRRYYHKHKEEQREYYREIQRESREDLIKELGGICQRCGRTAKAAAMDLHEIEKESEDKGKEFFKTSLGRLWLRYRKTKHREEVLELIRKKVMLLDVKCHRKVTAEEKKLGRQLSYKEVLKK